MPDDKRLFPVSMPGIHRLSGILIPRTPVLTTNSIMQREASEFQQNARGLTVDLKHHRCCQLKSIGRLRIILFVAIQKTREANNLFGRGGNQAA